jgi:uncharacterized protein involved in outer membrane biogenesis
MRKVLKVIGFIGVTFLLFFIVCGLAFYHLMRTGEFRRFLIEEVEKQTELKVELGDADLEIGWITGVGFSDLALSEPGAAQPAIRAQRLTARVALLPLLSRQIVFYEIRLRKPAALFVREPDGRIPLLDRLRNLPFLKQQSGDFKLDLHAIKIQDGAIAFADRWPQGTIGDWRLANGAVDVEWARGQRLRDVMQSWFKRGPAQSVGAALSFELKGALVKDDASMNLKSAGRLLFAKDSLDFHQARWSADIELGAVPAALAQHFAGAALPAKSLSGQLGQRIHVEGSAEKPWQLSGDVDFKGLAVDAPEVFLAPLAIGDGKASFAAEWSSRNLKISRGEFRAGDIKFSLQGEIDALDGDDPYLRMNFSALSAPLLALSKYLPLKSIDSPRLEKAVNSIQAGRLEIKKAGVDASLNGLRRMAQSGIGKQLWFDAELRDAAGNFGGVGVVGIDGMLPLRGADCRLALNQGVLTLQNLKGAYGDSQITDLDGRYDLSSSAGGSWEAQLRADVNLTELREQARSGLLSAPAAKLAAALQDLAGRGKVELALKRGANGPVEINGKAALDNGRLRYGDYALSEIKGELTFTPKEIKGEQLRALLSGAPIQIQLALRDYDSDNGSFSLAVDSTGIKAGVVTSLLLDTGTAQDSGVVRGALRYSGSFNNKERRKFSANLDLANLQVMVHPLLQPLRELNGKVVIDENGIDFQNLNANLAGFPAAASGRWRYAEKPQLLFDFSAPDLDVTYLISQIDPQVGEFYNNLQAEGKITLGKGRIKNFEFADLKTAATIDRRVWRLTNLTARSVGGTIVGATTIIDRPDTLGIVAEPKVQAVPVQSFLKWFNITNTEMTGGVNLTGKLETVGKNDGERKQNLNGAFNLRIEDGTIHRMRILVQILNLLDLSRWFTFQMPDLAKQGIRFRAITADFKVAKGVYTTENLIVDSSDLRMTGAGKIDVANDEIDLLLAVRPFPGIESAFNTVPILGRGLAAIMNSFLVGSFNVKGRIEDPAITPAPLGTLSEMFWGVLGIPKNVLTLGEAEKKEEAKEPAKAPATK